MADIAVANTTSNIQGQTVILAARDQTITGNHTFDRDPSAPFSVSANSAVVTNLDADKLDGSEGSSYVHKTNDCVFSSYTPTWGNTGTANTQGNCTVAGSYCQLGKLVFFTILFTFGSTSAVGNGAITFTLPVAADATQGAVNCTIRLSDSSGGTHWSAFPIATSTTVISLYSEDTTASQMDAVTATSPFTWATSDTVVITGMYKAA